MNSTEVLIEILESNKDDLVSIDAVLTSINSSMVIYNIQNKQSFNALA